jgi:CRISPR system Cascade subunit CasD
MPRHLVLRLHSPLIAFGGATIDNLGVITDFPALSMITGLIANALGWDRSDTQRHSCLQQRLRMGSRLERAGSRLRDYQTAELFEDDAGWTTRGAPEGRESTPTYTSDGSGRKALTLQRFRDYHADLVAVVALRLEPADENPTLDEVAQALDRPSRPLFIGRKPCLPAGRLMFGWHEAQDVLGVLSALPVSGGAAEPNRTPAVRAQWPDGEGAHPSDRILDVCDERDWLSGVHGGSRLVREGVLTPPERSA